MGLPGPPPRLAFAAGAAAWLLGAALLVLLGGCIEAVDAGRAGAGRMVSHHATAGAADHKACGLTGVRAACAVAPRGADTLVGALADDAPSWPIGADGVALLQAFASPGAQHELAACRTLLAKWRDGLAAMLSELGWDVRSACSVTPLFRAQPLNPLDTGALRAGGIKLCDTTGMGLAGWWRLAAQPPASIDALRRALRSRDAPRGAHGHAPAEGSA